MLRSPAPSDGAAPNLTAPVADVELSQPPVDCWVMPDLAGCSLHDAEVAIKNVTGGNPAVRTRSIDTSGLDRDRLSKCQRRVCCHSPEAGSWIRVGCSVSFHVVPAEAGVGPSE